MFRVATFVTFALVAASCAQAPADKEPVPKVSAAQQISTTTFASCSEYPPITAADSEYADTPIYVANEMPVEEIRLWAESKPGFEAIWIDRDRNGWVTVAFSEGAQARQGELAESFPDAGVVVVAVDWSLDDLLDLQGRVNDTLAPLTDSWSTGTSPIRGVVEVTVGVLTDEIQTEMEARFAGERLCLEGAYSPAEAVVEPQRTSGDGWRLLIDEPGVGIPYRTGIATDAASLSTLWTTIGLGGPVPEVDFETEVVIWFGAVYSGSCPDIRLAGIVVSGPMLYADIVLEGTAFVCTADANPRTYLVAVERDKLPGEPFAIQLGPDDPPAGAPEERTLVGIDISQPGIVAPPDSVGSDPGLFEPNTAQRSGTTIEPGFPVDFEMFVHCGFQWLGELNGFNWTTTEEPPQEWAELSDPEPFLEVSLLLTTDPEPNIDATAGSVTISYFPTTDPIPECD